MMDNPNLTPRQVLQVNEYKTIVETFGPFDQSSGSDGAHYAPADANPFQASGLVCANCVFFEGGRRCEIVAGDIDPAAVCKLWVIPENLLTREDTTDMDTEYREASSIIVRSAEERIIEGRAVPYMTPTKVGGYLEQFARGAFEGTDPASVKLYWRHGEPVGRILQLREKPDGLYFTAKFSDTTSGRDAWTLAKDGVEQGVSVGFRAVQDAWSADKTLVTREKASLVEISTTDRPAYAGAAVLATREEESTPTTEESEPAMDASTESNATAVDVRDARVEDILERTAAIETALTQLSEKREATPAAPLFRSFGEYAIARAQGDEKAELMFRAISEASTAEVAATSLLTDTWLDRIRGIVNHGRPTVTAFGTAPLPASGLKLHWPTVTQMPTVASQDLEDDLISSTKMIIEDAEASIVLYAGGGRLSRKLIDRTSPSYVNTLLVAMAAAYGKTTEGAFLAEVLDQAAVSDAFGGSTASHFVEGIANAAADIYDETGFSADFVAVSRDVFTSWAALSAGDRPVFSLTAGGQNVIGGVNIAGLSGSFANIPVLMIPQATTGTVLVASREGAKFHESAGAPLQLTNDKVDTLQRDIAVYGYGLSAVYAPAAIRSVALHGA